MKNLLIVILVLLFQIIAYSQQKQDSPWGKNIAEREPIAYQKVREADVFWSKRLWRIIDTREKQNLIFNYPQLPLSKILHTAVLNQEIAAYDNSIINGDQFLKKLTKEELEKVGVSDELMWVANEHGEEKEINIHHDFDYSKITRYKIKEDWFFNSATSTLEVRILGIAPLLETYDENGNYLGDETIYWIYYNDLRPVLAKYEAYNPGNFAVRLSWDDIFEARFFASYIYKEDNVYDRKIQEYASRQDALYESERIKELIFNFEHDVWSY